MALVFMVPITWPEIALIWGYSIGSALLTDAIKVQVYRHLERRTRQHQEFLTRVQQPLHGYGKKE